MVIYKKVSKIQKVFVSQIILFSLKVDRIAFVSTIVLSRIITESSIILAKYLHFLQLHVARFQI